MTSTFVTLLLLYTLCISVAAARQAIANGVAECESEYVTVAPTDHPFEFIRGCYRKSRYLTALHSQVYTNKDGDIEGTTYGILKAPTAPSHREEAWIIGRISLPDEESDSVAGSVRVREVVCSGESGSDMNAPLGKQRWDCEDEGSFAADVQDTASRGAGLTILCGCSTAARTTTTAEGNVDLASGVFEITTNLRRISRGLGDGDSGDMSGLWPWIIIAAGTVGLILLCCVGWCIRNPWCKKPPAADPNASVEDAAPQAPKTAFQPWGTSAPPM